MCEAILQKLYQLNELSGKRIHITHRIVDAKLNEFIPFVLNSRRMKVEQETNKTSCITVEMQFYGYIYYYFSLDSVSFWDRFVRQRETFIKKIVIFVILKKCFGKIISSNSTAYDLKCVVYISFKSVVNQFPNWKEFHPTECNWQNEKKNALYAPCIS